MDRQHFLDLLEKPALDHWQPSQDVPGLNRPAHRPAELPGSGRVAAVMVLLFPPTAVAPLLTGSRSASLEWFDSSHHDRAAAGSPAPWLVLTERPVSMGRHAGQISLPGGRQDPGETLVQTAIRETGEEIGIEPERIEILGSLQPVYIPPTDFTIHPVVGWHEPTPRILRNEAEVAAILMASMTRLLEPSTWQTGTIYSESRRYDQVPHFRLGRHRVWGATAIVLRELIARVRAHPGS